MTREEFRQRLEAEGVETVRLRLKDPKNYTDRYRAAAIEWLGEMDNQRVAASDASNALQVEAASRAAKAAERAADAAERANTKATIANVIAALAVIVAAVSLVISIFRPFDRPEQSVPSPERAGLSATTESKAGEK